MTKYNHEQKLIERFDFTQRKPLTDIIYLGLKQVIIDGIFPLGERINENSLAMELSCSRTPIRNALNRLIDEGLVGYVPDHGTFVKSVDIKRIKEIYKIRKSLEVLLYEEVEKKATQEDLLFLKKSTKKMVQFGETNMVPELVDELNQFNAKIHEIAEMATLTNLLEELNAYFKNFRNFSFSTRKRRLLAIKEHSMMVRLIEAKEPEYLKYTVEKHILHAEAAAIQFFTSSEFKEGIIKRRFYNPQRKLNCVSECDILTKQNRASSDCLL